MSKELEKILDTIKFLRRNNVRCEDRYVNFSIFRELLCREAQPIQVNAPQVGGNYVHRALYDGVVFITTTRELLRKPI